MESIVGEIREINRYPVKSFAGERLETCVIEPYGMLGDRFCAFMMSQKRAGGGILRLEIILKCLPTKRNLSMEKFM